MFYLSDVIGKRILDRQHNRVARVRDLVAEVLVEDKTPSGDVEVAHRPSPGEKEQDEAIERDAPIIKGVVARMGRSNRPFYVPISQIDRLRPGDIRLRSSKVDLQPFERRPGEILLARDLWDKQVIDLETRRVVRVNDIAIAETPTPGGETGEVSWWVRGVDVGLGGLARRLHLHPEKTRLMQNVTSKTLQPRIVRWSQLDVFGSNVPGGVEVPHRKLAGLHPVEIARITDSVSYHQGAEIIASLDDTLAADTLEEIDDKRQGDIMEYVPEDRAADILEEMAPDEATDLLAELPEDKAGSLLDQMEEEDAQEVRYLMRYPEHSAGGIMTTDFVQALPMMTVGDVIEANKDTFLSADLIYYVYVVRSFEEPVLVGIITVRDLLVHERNETVSDFMLTECLTAHPGDSERDVARRMAEYNLLALPVVDQAGTLLGVVTVDDALDALLPEGWRKRLPKIFS